MTAENVDLSTPEGKAELREFFEDVEPQQRTEHDRRVTANDFSLCTKACFEVRA